MAKQGTLFDLPSAPHVRGSDTSKEAAVSIRPQLGSLQMVVLAFIRERAAFGATCDEVEATIGLKHQTCSARIKELRDKGYIEDSGMRRLTQSKRKATVYVAVSEGVGRDVA